MKKNNKKGVEFVPLHLYGIFNIKNKKMYKVSLDRDEIDMEIALAGNENLVGCDCDITLALCLRKLNKD